MDQKDENEPGPSNNNILYRIALNDNKAGMEGLDKEKINKIIMGATKGSRYYIHLTNVDQQVDQRIEKILQQKALLTSSQINEAQIQVDRLAMELERRRDLSRVIVHVDMDAFYASVETRDNPELKGKPMAVGTMSMLSTSNYLARRFGVRASMPGFIGKKLCPDLIIVPPDFNKYQAVCKEIRKVIAEYDPSYLPMSLDEVYMDITDHLEERLTWPEERRTYVKADNVQKDNSTEAGVVMTTETSKPEQTQCTSPVLFEDSPSFLEEQNLSPPMPDTAKLEKPMEKVIVFGTSAEEAVKELRFRIEQKTSLTASAGIAPNKRLAKVCSEKNKPNGQYTIPNDKQAVMDFVKDLPIRKVLGIGEVTEKMMNALGIKNCADLYQQRALLSLLFPETTWHNFLNISLGLGSTNLERVGGRKTMSTERTFNEISSPEEQYELCRELCKDLADDLLKEGLKVCVRVSGFISDGKPQNLITNFLCVRRPIKKISLETMDKVVQEMPAPCPQRESFFNQKRAARQQELLQSSTGKDNTIKDQTVTNPLSEVPKNDADEAKEKPDFTCPICFMKQEDWGLEGFNKHIDECLSKSPSSGYSEMPNKGEHFQRKMTANNGGHENNIHANNIKNKIVTIPSCDDLNDFIIDKNTLNAIQGNQVSEADQKACNSEILSEDVLNNIKKQADLKDINKPTMSTPPSSSGCIRDSALICPVCNIQQDTTDLTTFNRHVDICLNKGILEELKDDKKNMETIHAPAHQSGITERGSSTNKPTLRSKRPGSTPQNPASKKARTSRSSNTIKKFFK
uniref:DNA polymerase kappa n=1 Tax=Pyxicephalus adspersus TaxID=30357 RepID=A0AAV2ZXZ5_PYXAD|nr:TPA: hypothetical protein GDO54_014387 [Pyxicephalus adspersus]